ncbi:MAG: quinoprotein dehydrogenase-associated SoxYZ-like carrier [Magnetospiraceae bacterium]
MVWKAAIACALTVALVSPRASAAAETIPDPLQSPYWDVMQDVMFDAAPVVMDDRVRVIAPTTAEDNLQVPVSIDASSLGKVQELIVFADLNPISKVAHFYPERARPYLELRLKVNQATPIRAAALTEDGVWHVGGVWVDAAGGGCTTPSMGMTSGDWTETLGHVQARVWDRKAQGDRLRFRVMHPMDTGLVDGIPAFYIETLTVTDAEGAAIARLETFEPVMENPVFSIEVDPSHRAAKGYTVMGVDNNGNQVNAFVPRDGNGS